MIHSVLYKNQGEQNCFKKADILKTFPLMNSTPDSYLQSNLLQDEQEE